MELLERFMNPPTEAKMSTNVKPNWKEGSKMLALSWQGKESLKFIEHEAPTIKDPKDAIIKITTSTICGSDLHMYFNKIPGMKNMWAGDILGHEGVGIVEDVGPAVTNLKVGDRVAVSFCIADGTCWYCQQGYYSYCDTTNPSGAMEAQYGARSAGLFGYSHLTGSYAGLQAEYARVPFADVNTLKIPDSMSDDVAMLFSDMLCTSWHACELGDIGPQTSTVAVWGCGPVGLLIAAWAKFRGAKRVIAIDREPYRLDMARRFIECDTINSAEQDVRNALKAANRLGGPDVCMDAVGFRFPTSLSHKLQTMLNLESDAIDVINEMVFCARKCGTLVLIGDYFGDANGFPIGALMEKSLTLRGGQAFVQRYWHKLLDIVSSGAFDASFVITHRLPFDRIADAYQTFADHKEGAVKMLLYTKNHTSPPHFHPGHAPQPSSALHEVAQSERLEPSRAARVPGVAASRYAGQLAQSGGAATEGGAVLAAVEQQEPEANSGGGGAEMGWSQAGPGVLEQDVLPDIQVPPPADGFSFAYPDVITKVVI